MYSLRLFDRAEKAYEQVLENFGDREVYAARARLGLAYCKQELQDYEAARKMFERVKADGLYVAEAERMLKLLEKPPTLPVGVLSPGKPVPEGTKE